MPAAVSQSRQCCRIGTSCSIRLAQILKQPAYPYKPRNSGLPGLGCLSTFPHYLYAYFCSVLLHGLVWELRIRSYYVMHRMGRWTTSRSGQSSNVPSVQSPDLSLLPSTLILFLRPPTRPPAPFSSLLLVSLSRPAALNHTPAARPGRTRYQQPSPRSSRWQ